LAELLFERMHTIFAGRAATAHRGEAYVKLTAEHPYRGVLLERVVIGQRLGLLYADATHRENFARPLEYCLASLIATSGVDALRAAYLDRNSPPSSARLRPGVLVASRLRAAPAIGAAVAALRAAE
jgi:hypothetical protein